jgi:hypothetical protein
MTGFGFASTTDDVLDGVDLTGRTVVVTGTSAGLGVETARALVAHGATVVGIVRDVAKARRNLDEAGAGATGVELHEADLASLSSIRAFTDAFLAAGPGRIDVLIANAGLMACPQGATADGFELQFGDRRRRRVAGGDALRPRPRHGDRALGPVGGDGGRDLRPLMRREARRQTGLV